MGTQDPPSHDVEEDDELEMIRSMLRAEENKDVEGRKHAHSKIISKLGDSTSSLFTLSPANEAVYDNERLFDENDGSPSNATDTSNTTDQSTDAKPDTVQDGSPELAEACDEPKSQAKTMENNKTPDAFGKPPTDDQPSTGAGRSRSSTLANEPSASASVAPSPARVKAPPSSFARSLSSAQESVASGVSESASSQQGTQPAQQQTQQQYPSRLPGVRKRVSQLLRHRRQREPLVVEEGTNVRQVCEQMAATRNSAFLMITHINGVKRVSGIGTDVDICKAVSMELNPESTKVSEIMTPWPKSVEPSDEAQIAFKIMVGNRFRHLPVIERDGSVAGLIDIAQCLYDGIAQLESIQRAQASFMDAVRQTRLRWLQDQSETNQDGNVAHHMINTMMDDSTHDVRSLVSTAAPLKCSASSSVKEAAALMYKARKTAILVFKEERSAEVEGDAVHGSGDEGDKKAAAPVAESAVGGGKVCGILTTKDILSRVVAKGLDAGETQVASVMTPDPDTIPLDCSLIDALHVMLDGRYLHIPVEDNGKVCGVLDVLDCAVAMFGPALKNKKNGNVPVSDHQHGQSNDMGLTAMPEFADLLFENNNPSSSSVGGNDLDSVSQYSGAGRVTGASGGGAAAQMGQHYHPTDDDSRVGNNRQNQNQPHQLQRQRSQQKQQRQQSMMIADGNMSNSRGGGRNEEDDEGNADTYGDVQMVIKVRDMTRGGKLSRVRCDLFDYDSAVLAVLGSASAKERSGLMWYVDEDGDEITLDSLEAFSAACHLYQSLKWSKLEVVVRSSSSGAGVASRGGGGGIVGFVSEMIGSLFGGGSSSSGDNSTDNVNTGIVVAGAVLVALSGALAMSTIVMYSDTNYSAGSGHGPSYHRSGGRRHY